MPVEDFVAPGDDGVDDVVELGELAGGVEVGEPVECFECAVTVIGLVEAVEFLECVPSGSQSWVGTRIFEVCDTGVPATTKSTWAEFAISVPAEVPTAKTSVDTVNRPRVNRIKVNFFMVLLPGAFKLVLRRSGCRQNPKKSRKN